VELTRIESGAIAWWTDVALRTEHGIVVAFTERAGGVSAPPFDTLDLAAHVGDVAGRVDENRDRLLSALGLEHVRGRLTTAAQVHGSNVAVVGGGEAGSGAFADGGRPPVPAADGLMTSLEDTPLMLLFADCVPLVLVATGPRPAVAVVHAGWRGAAAGIVAEAVARLAEKSGSAPSDVLAFVGPHIGPCHYEVGDEHLSRFAGVAATISPAPGRLDLLAAVVSDLDLIGVPMDQRASLGICTAEETGRFYSYRAEGRTGRHGAIAGLLEQ
jgi:YfiH family protein